MTWTVLQIVPKLDTGGAERSAIEIAEALAQAGHRAWIMAQAGPWSDWARRVGAELIELPIGAKSPSSFLLLPKLRRLLGQVDLVHSRSRLPSWLTWLALRSMSPSARPRWVTTVHGLHSVGRYSAIQHSGELAIAVSQTAKDFVERNYPSARGRLQVIARGADTRVFYPGQNDASWRLAFETEFPHLAGKELLLLAGRGTRLKGHQRALTLLRDLRQSGRDVYLFCAGVVERQRSDYLSELQELARQLGVEDAVVFASSRGDLPALYAHCALVLQLSNRPESFGRTVSEALLCGAKVLGFAHGGVAEQLESAFPAGLVALNASDAQLAAHVAHLLEYDPLIESSQIATLAQMQSATLAAYQRLLDSPRR